MKKIRSFGSAAVYGLITILAVIGTVFRCLVIHAEKSAPRKDTDNVNVPIIMYHSVLKDKTMRGDYIVTPEEVEADIIYLKEHGYTAVFIGDLINYVSERGELPEKPVVLTFDDGFYNNYLYILPLLQKYDFKASVSVVGSYTTDSSESAAQPDPAYSYLRWSDIKDMRVSGYFEICSHTYAMHELSPRKGVLRSSNESHDTYRSEFKKDVLGLQKLFEENCAFKPNVFTYPYGFYDTDSMQLVRECGFEASLSCEERMNVLKKCSPESLYEMGRFNRAGGISTEEFMSKALALKEDQ